MTKSVTTKYNFWIGGYYDDFNSARCVADDLNAANIRTLDHTKTHFGSAIGDNARLNPRFKFSTPDRTRTGAYFLNAPNMGSFTNLASNIEDVTAVTDALTHNSSMADWLKYDTYRDTTSRTISQSKPKHPNSVLANRQRFGGVATGDNYLAFFNGHDTFGKYYCPVGEVDFSYAASPLSIGNTALNGGTNTLSSHAGSPIPFFQRGDFTGNTTTPFGYNGSAVAHRKIALVSFASVYMSEAPNTDTTNNRPDSYSYPIKSPSGNNFFIHNQYIPRGIGGMGGQGPDVTNGTERVITYDGPLKIKGIGESFHLRMRTDLPTQDLAVTYTLKIGYKGTTTYDKSANAFADTTSIVSITFDSALLGQTNNPKWENGIDTALPDRGKWTDIEVVFDFSNNTYKAYQDGDTTHFASGSVNTSVDELTAIGWSLDMNWTFQNSVYYGNVITMIDRAAMALPLTNKFDGTIPAPVSEFSLNRGVNKISQATLQISDDNNSYNLAALTTGAAASEWRLHCFLNNEDRPIWSGVINSVRHKQSHSKQTLDTTIKADDSLSILDRTLPIWELGQNSFISLNNHISMASTVEKRVEETTAISDTLLMGAGRMGHKGIELGYSKYDTDTYSGGFSPIADSRTQLYSGSAIQMYINEDEDGPNNVENEWEGDDVMEITGLSPNNGTRMEVYVKFDDRIYTSTPSDGVISSYGNLSSGDSVVLKGTGYDNSYLIHDISLRRDITSEEDIWFVRIQLTYVGAGISDGRLFILDEAESLNENYEGKILLKLTTTTAHGLEIGDEFALPAGARIDTSTPQYFTNKVLQVIAAPTTTTLHVLVERWPFALNTAKAISSINASVYDLTKINGKDSTSYPKTHAVLYKSNTITSQAPQIYSKHRNIHARWMRDLPQSTWFKAQFGVIAAEPYWRHGKGSFLDRPFNSVHASDLVSMGWNADGSVKLDTMISDLTTSTTSFQINDPAIWYYTKTNRLKEFIIDLVDKDTTDHQYIIASNATAPATNTTVDFISANRFQTSSAHGLVEGQIVVHTQFTNEKLNGVFMVDIISSTLYYGRKIDGFIANTDAFSYLRAKNRGDSSWNDGISREYQDPDAIEARLLSRNHTFGESPETGGKAHYGLSTISGVKGIKREWKKENTIYTLRKVDESNGYKHCWVLWADMRNNGKANADAGYRKTDFGLTLPTSQNYEVNLSFANQFDEFGLPDTFCDLKVGEDLDIWSLDATSEPYTGNAWETLEGGSNEEPFDHYHNWKDKGGAVCLVDASRFWNLNTNACGGRPGYKSGGLADFGDYEIESHGFPYLIDNYWQHATASYKNVTKDTHFMQYHKNYRNFINDGSRNFSDIAVGDTKIYLKNAQNFESSGYGVIQCTGGQDRDSEKTNYYFFWEGKGREQVDNHWYQTLTGVYITEYEVVTGPKNAIDQLKADQAAGLTGSDVAIRSNEFLQTAVDGNFDTVRVYNTPAALFAFRLIMNVSGLVKAPNSGTYFAHDKLRYLQSMLLTDNWSTNASLPCIWDIQNVPKTSDFGGDDYGSIHDAKTQTIMGVLNSIKEKDGVGLSGGLKDFGWLMGRDNRLEFRTTYNSNHTFNRNNLKVSDLNTSGQGRITNVRVYYNGNSAFVDHPTPSGSDIRWKVLSYPDIFNGSEALSLAKQEYQRENTARISVNAEVLRPSGDTNVMTDGGRYGYVADVCRNMVRNNTDSMAWWTNTLGGSPFFGIQNALDSSCNNGGINLQSPNNVQIYATTYSSSQGESDPTSFKADVGIVSKANGALITSTLPTNGLLDKVFNNQFRWSYDGNTANYGPTVTVSHGSWHKLESTVGGVTYELSLWCQKTINTGATGPAQLFYHQCLNRTTDAYHWYGTNSLSNAIQVVHVDKDTNKTSATSGNELRLAISYDSGSTADVALFRLWALDYSFSEVPDVSGGSGNEKPPTFASTLEGSTSILIDGNGMFEMTLPSSYDSNSKKVIFSVDIDYLRDVLSARFAGTVLKNAHNISGLSTYSAFDGRSPFPLGMREHVDLLDSCEIRAGYYAPRLHVVDDLNFIPATTVSYTDTHVDLSGETMVIKDVNWMQKGNNHEKVTMKLEKLSKHYSYSMAQVFARGGGNGGGGGGGYTPQGPPPPPTGPAMPPFGGGFGGSIPNLGQLVTVSNVNEDSQSQFSGLTSNQMSKGLMRGLRGKSDFANDRGSSNATWGVLGSKKTGSSSSFDRAIDGIDSNSSSSGSAIATSDGFTLAGISDPEVGQQGEVHTHTMNVRVPNDSSTGFVSVLASVSLPSITGGGNAEITTTVTCTETNSSITNTKTITSGVSNANTILLPTQFLNGAGTPNNTLVVTFERKPAQGNDSAGYQSLVIHNVSVNVRRYNQPTVAQNNTFKAY